MSAEYGFRPDELKAAIEKIKADLVTHFDVGEPVPWDTPAIPVPVANFDRVRALVRSQDQNRCKSCGEHIGVVFRDGDDLCSNCSAFAIPDPCPKCGNTTLYEYSDFDLAFPNKIKVQICAECAFAWNPDYKEPIQSVIFRPHVKQIPEYPARGQHILIWAGDYWFEGRGGIDGGFWYHHGVYEKFADGQYWMPMITFNPEPQGDEK